MKALFLAGGFGTRLKPMTNDLPKPMVPIMGKPLLERNIENLKKYGIDEIVLSTCYKRQRIESYFGGGGKLGVKISYIFEDIPLGTAGAIKYAEKLLGDNFIVFNADILCDIDIADMIRFHVEKGAIATIAATQVDNPYAYGVIEHDGNGFITAFKEKPLPGESNSSLVNAGVYVLDRRLLEEIPSGRPVSVERETYPVLLSKGYKIAVYDKCAYWLDVGTPRQYIKIHKDIMRGAIRLGELDFGKERRIVGNMAKINRNARIIEPVYIGNNVEIAPFSIIGPDTALFDGSIVGTGAKVVGSIVWERGVVESGAMVVNSVVMSDCTVARNSEEYNCVIAGNAGHTVAV